MATAERHTVIDNTAEERFEVEGTDPLAGLSYDTDGSSLVLLHTYVPPRYEGKGLGGLLVSHAVEHAIANDLTVVPTCPFANAWLKKHPEVASRAIIGWPDE